MVSAACWLGLSPGPSATAMPPWDQALALSARVSLVTSTADCPSDASRQAVQRPAMPVPTITGRGGVMGGNIAGTDCWNDRHRGAALRLNPGKQNEAGEQKD